MGVDFGKALAGVTALGAGIAILAGATGAFEQVQRNTTPIGALREGPPLLDQNPVLVVEEDVTRGRQRA